MQDILHETTIIKVPTSDGIIYINTDDIIRVQAISNYSKLYFAKANGDIKSAKTLVVAKVLRWFEEKLSDEKFVRIHRTHIVNKSFIRNYITATLSPAGGGKVYLENGETIDISKRKKTIFLKSWYRPTA